MTTAELVALKDTNEEKYQATLTVLEAKKAALGLASQEVSAAQEEVLKAKQELEASKAELARALGYVAPKPLPPIIKTIPVSPQNQSQSPIVWVIVAIIGLVLADKFNIIDINNPFNPVPPAPGPGPEPDPIPKPITDPLRVSYIYDKESPLPAVRDIRNGVEKIEEALNSINASYRSYDINDEEVQKNYLEAVNASGNELPILIIQNDRTGKLVGKIIKSPASVDDLINATKNARNGNG